MLPKLLFVSERKERNGPTWLLADRLALDVIEGDGPTLIGTYQLVGRRALKKSPIPVEVKKVRKHG